MTSAVVQAEALNKVFINKQKKEQVVALASLDMCVKKGELTALVGPDGAGKTTLLRLIAGLMTPTQGRLSVLDIDMYAHPQQVQNLISYMPQRFGLYEDLSVQENLDLYADLHGVPADERHSRYQRLLTMTNLADFTARPAGKLSGGMKQKLGLACTLVRSPQLLLLDEPTVGVDPLSRQELWKIILQLVEEESLTVIVSTAYLDEAARCQQVHLLHEGKILVSGSPDTLTQRAQNQCYLFTPNPEQKPRELQSALLDKSDLVVDAVPQGGRVRCVLHPNNTIEDVTKDIPYNKVEPVVPSLEDAFMMSLKEHMPLQSVSVEKLKKDHKAKPDASSPIVSVKQLVKTFGDFTAVAKTSFDVYPGEIFGLLGPNGAGKTTTFRMLCGLLPATSGVLSVAGKNLRTARADARGRIGYVSQKFALYGNLTVYENLRFFAGTYNLWGKQRKAAIERVSEQFDLASHLKDKSGELPGGYKQRLAMAASLMHQPDILFLDEPTSGADPLARRAFWRRITALSQTGTAIIITTHFMEEAEYCDKILIQDAGEKLAMGTPEEIRADLADTGGEVMSMEETFINIIAVNRRKKQERSDED
ncbi:ATP-binding cassette domain-containing protein [Alteromonas sp. C1M14]|uniref:ATP-binding cassette domain-containing protein n=1 Tax=Alteromonas sp. C1M14 TaxID=2841567 RepID=UPI001C0A07F0|nr:ATP-binding cassette domain-containing protein [Alteromonas sp. C1M14]MBU2977777.1 ATP-binding cassette domain-containing protein [Alteromonas sp. C1M14]